MRWRSAPSSRLLMIASTRIIETSAAIATAIARSRSRAESFSTPGRQFTRPVHSLISFFGQIGAGKSVFVACAQRLESSEPAWHEVCLSALHNLNMKGNILLADDDPE